MTKKQFFTLSGICLLGCMLMLASLILKSHIAGVEWNGSSYNIENVNPVDAKFARPYNETLDTIGDVFVVFSGLIVAVSVFTSFFASKDKLKGFKIAFVDSLIFGISWLYGNSFYRMLKTLAGRIRPYMYFENPSQKGIEKGDFFLSWPSGHSANVFIAFGFLLTWFTVRYADSKLKKPVLTFTFAVCVTTMILRMLSGNHFMTDVLSGAAIGCVSGYFISALCYRINGEKKMIIAIDGPAGTGKSTIAKMLAEKLDITFLNSGGFYRTLTMAVLDAGIDYKDEKATLDFCRKQKIEYTKEGHFILNGKDVTDHLHDDRITANASQVSSIVEIRHLVNDLMREITKSLSIVCEGRDMTTVVFPNAEVKVYLDASAEVRAKRRFDQGVSDMTLEEIKAAIEKRDEMDKNKKEGSLKIAKDALYIDTSNLTIDNVCAIIEKQIS